MTKIKEFNNLDLMQTVRNNHLNPLIRRIEDVIIPTLEQVETEIHESVKTVTLDTDTKVMKFDKGLGGYKEIDLNPIMPKAPGIGVKDVTGQGPSTGIEVLHFPDAKVDILSTGKDVSVGFKWPEIFDHNQKWTEAVVDGTLSEMKSVTFLGDPEAVKVKGTNVALKIPKVTPFKASIPEGTPVVHPAVDINEIKVVGEVGGTGIKDGVLTLNLSAGGGGGGITNQNFKGFFESLGDIESLVQDPQDGKSYAFAKDSTLGGLYYTPYFFVNGAWKELKQDPALTYSAPSDPMNHGVFSIKPSEKIKVDATGQLDLDGLSTPQLPQYFVGFYETLDALKSACPKPVPFQTFAYVKGPANGWLNYRSETQGSASLWKVVAPMGSFSFVDGGTASYRQVFGIRKSDDWEVDAQGLLSLKKGSGGGSDGMQVGVSGYDGNLITHDIKTMTYNKGKAMASFSGTDNSELTIEHPQRVINYNNTWEMAHNSRDYEGNIFYDETSRCWMGWGIPKVPGAVDNKWTRIAHPHMSDEVQDLVRRVPPKAKSVTPGLIGDHQEWDHIGVTFIEAGNDNLPSELKGACGGYITTVVQDKDAAGVTIPQYRMQTCLADREEGGTWIRRLLATGSSGSAISWSSWVKSSFGSEEIIRHEHDPNAHKSVIRFYRVISLKGNVWNLHNQEQEGVKGILREANRDLLVDNYGVTDSTLDWGTIPYDNGFKGSGVIEFSGYEGVSSALGKWTIKVRVIRKGTTVPIDFYEASYTQLDDKVRFPPLRFEVPKGDGAIGDQILVHLYFDNPVGLKNKHPDLYICPIKSYMAFQDYRTTAGSDIGETYRNLLGRIDSFGDVGVRVHHNSYDTKKNVRVYGVISNATPTEMKTVLKP